MMLAPQFKEILLGKLLDIHLKFMMLAPYHNKSFAYR